MLNYDSIEVWSPAIYSIIANIFPPDIDNVIHASSLTFYEDAWNALIEHDGERCSNVIDSVVDWISTQTVSAYHGTRLTDMELEDVRRNGLKILNPVQREVRLRTALSTHARWAEVEGRLKEVIASLMRGDSGKRDGRVCATLSRSGLINGYNHFIKFGSEFDSIAASKLLGDDGLTLLSNYGKPYLIQLGVPGALAVKANNPYNMSLDDHHGIAFRLAQAWAYRRARPEWSCQTLNADIPLTFSHDLPNNWIVAIDPCDVGLLP